MTRRAALVIATAALLLSSATPFQRVIAPATFIAREPTLTIFEAEELVSRAPAQILLAIAITESGLDPNAIGCDGHDRGLMQTRELYHDERARKHGEYDPMDPRDSVRIAGGILMEHYQRFGSWTMAVSSYNAGAGRTARDGVYWAYVDLVEKALGCSLSEFDGVEA